MAFALVLSSVYLVATVSFLLYSRLSSTHKLSSASRMNRSGLRAMTILLLCITTSIITFYGSGIAETNSNVVFDPFLEGGPPPVSRKRSYNQRKYFWDNHRATSCFSLDHICHGNDKWFYLDTGDASTDQPTVTYVQDNVTQTHGYFKVEPRIFFNVSSSSATIVDHGKCPIDPTPYHMVVQSAYNDMMGEFYSRSLVALNQLLHDNPIDGSYYTDLQMYLHVVEKKKQNLFEGHRLFLGGLPNNNKFDSFLSLVESDTCQCFQKLVFCGYDLETASEYEPVNKTSAHGFNALPAEYKSGDAKVFKPVGHVRSQKTKCTRTTSGKFDLKETSCYAYRDLRHDIHETFEKKDAGLLRKILEYRKQILLSKGVISANITAKEVNEWKFVGLTKRKKRRVWLDLYKSISLCDNKFRKDKVVCFPIDVEDASSPEKQLLMHRSLDAIIGVHGAQLTQAVLLPPHGKILELLPWVPPYLQGNWVQWTNRPTPLGVIYHKTDLNHFGYKLNRDSVPLCFNVTNTDTEGLRECFMSKENLRKFQWATRSFTVPPDVIGKFISSFVLNDKSVCDGMQLRAKRNDFVLYNAYCRSDETNHRFHAVHYFTEDNKVKE